MKYLSMCCCLLWGTSLVCADDTDELKRIKENYTSMLLPVVEAVDSLQVDWNRIEPEREMSDQVVVELHQRYPFDLAKIEGYVAKLSDDGSWTDINYLDKKRSGWEPKQHAERILELAKLYCSPVTGYYRSETLKQVIHRALGYWFSAKHKCPNWWYNQIGIPKTLGTAFNLLEDQLSGQEKAGAIEVMENSKFGMTGQNKVWLAGNVLIRALLQNDAELVKMARDTIASEIVLGRREGIKDDWSFHQHGPQQQFGNYGLSFVSGMSFFYRLFKGTAYEFDGAQVDILTSLVNEGYKWTIWNRMMDISALGRQLFHNAQLHKAYGLAFAAADLGIGGFPARGNLLVGHKHFDDSDYTVHRSKSWMGTVKMSSNRVIGTELVNEDNLKGYYLGDGATYFYVRGDEYLNVFPFWDWRKVPGVTAYEDVAPVPDINVTRSGNKTDNVGGLSDGKCGMAAMELNRDVLTACKAKLITGDEVLCLGAGISSDSALWVTTSIDQRLQCGTLEVLDKNAWREVSGKENFLKEDLRFFHDRTGYVVLGSGNCMAEAGKRTGSWHDFMKMYRPATTEGEVVSLYLSHGVKPENAGYQYLVFPDSNKEAIKDFDVNGVNVIRNDATAQVVSMPAAGKGYWIAAYKPVQLDMEGLPLEIHVPGIYYVERENGCLQQKSVKPFRPSGKKRNFHFK